ncbi:nucleotide-binding alpha-beta plait domain-containing protein [Tanacetum coccineum]
MEKKNMEVKKNFKNDKSDAGNQKKSLRELSHDPNFKPRVLARGSGSDSNSKKSLDEAIPVSNSFDLLSDEAMDEEFSTSIWPKLKGEVDDLMENDEEIDMNSEVDGVASDMKAEFVGFIILPAANVVAVLICVFVAVGIIERMEDVGLVGNNADPRVYVVDGKPLKSILRKPRVAAVANTQNGGMYDDMATGKKDIGSDCATGSGSRPANVANSFQKGSKPTDACSKPAATGGSRADQSHAYNGSNINVEGSDAGIKNTWKSTPSTNATNSKHVNKKVNFRALVNKERVDNSDTVLPKAAIEIVKIRYENSLVGFFVGKTIAFSIVQNYVNNTWGQFGLQKLMKSDDGVYLFKFASKVGLEKVLERGPWMIRNSPLILSKWTPYTSLTKNEVTKVPVWINLRKIPVVAYSEDGLSLIATQVGKPIMLNAFTSQMYRESWGRIRTFGHAHDSCPKRATEKETKHMDEEDDGFTEVKKRKNKVPFTQKKKAAKLPNVGHISGDRPTKPKQSCYQPKTSSVHANGKPVSSTKKHGDTSHVNPFDVLNNLDVEEDNGIEDPLISESCSKGGKDLNIGVSSSEKKNNLVFSPQPKIYYFDRDDTDDANMDVGAECGAFSSTDTQNEDLVSDEEVDEHIFPKGDKFDIRLKGRSRQ